MDTIDTIMKSIVNLRVHIAPVGFEVDRIVIPAVSQKADKVWLIAHDNVSEDLAVKYRENVEKELEKNGIKVEIAYANRLRLFPIIKTVADIIHKERKNDIYVNVASGSKIHAIGCMMACMLFDDREKIHPFYAQAEKYPEYDGTLQQTYGVAEVHSLPTYRIGTPKSELIKAMRIIKEGRRPHTEKEDGGGGREEQDNNCQCKETELYPGKICKPGQEHSPATGGYMEIC